MQSEHKQPQIEFQFSTDSIFSDTTLYMSRVTDNYTTSCHFLCCVLQEMIFEIFLNAFLASLFIKYRPKRNQSFFFFDVITNGHLQVFSKVSLEKQVKKFFIPYKIMFVFIIFSNIQYLQNAFFLYKLLEKNTFLSYSLSFLIRDNCVCVTDDLLL